MIGCTDKQVMAGYDIVPLPQSVKTKQEAPFIITKNTVITYPEGDTLLQRNAKFLSEYVQHATGYELAVKTVLLRNQLCLISIQK